MDNYADISTKAAGEIASGRTKIIKKQVKSGTDRKEHPTLDFYMGGNFHKFH